MNKTEHAIMKGVFESLNEVSGPIQDDTWEAYGERMKATIKTNIKILRNLVAIEPTDNEGIQL